MAAFSFQDAYRVFAKLVQPDRGWIVNDPATDFLDSFGKFLTRELVCDVVATYRFRFNWEPIRSESFSVAGKCGLCRVGSASGVMN